MGAVKMTENWTLGVWRNLTHSHSKDTLDVPVANQIQAGLWWFSVLLLWPLGGTQHLDPISMLRMLRMLRMVRIFWVCLTIYGEDSKFDGLSSFSPLKQPRLDDV